MRLIDIIRRHRRGFTLAVSLIVVEKLAWIIEPTLFGRLLDALIAAIGSGHKSSYALPLTLWIGAFVVNSGVGSARRSIDERIYLKMFTGIAVDVAESSVTWPAFEPATKASTPPERPPASSSRANM